MIYLASPFAHPEFRVRFSRYQAARFVLIDMLAEGLIVYSPIVHLYKIASQLNWSHEQYIAFDLHFLKLSSKLVVTDIPGFDQSLGITQEIEFAKAHNIPVELKSTSEIIPLGIWEDCKGDDC